MEQQRRNLSIWWMLKYQLTAAPTDPWSNAGKINSGRQRPGAVRSRNQSLVERLETVSISTVATPKTMQPKPEVALVCSSIQSNLLIEQSFVPAAASL